MHRIRLLAPGLLAAAVASLPITAAHAGANVDRGPVSAATGGDTELGDRFIVKFRDGVGDPRTKLTALGSTFGERLDLVRVMSGGSHVVQLGRRVMRAEAHEVARRLAADPRVALVEPDVVMHPMVVPNDTMYGQQWHYYESAGGINLPGAWDVTTGSADIRIAVIDTGVRPHVELASRLIGGYDFISSASVSNDGGGRDADASDSGDYGCNGSSSSWHGTHVAGTIGAASNNGAGVTGINWVSKIVPLRVLGKCGGYTSDIVDAMRWAAGIDVSGVPTNPYPARVVNLSLGASGTCSSSFQSAVNDAVAKGTVVVVAAGNSATNVSNSQPANCSGVIAVAATTRNGGRASYSNYGAGVTIAAPGGGGNDGVLSTLNSGSTTPGADSYAWYQGTSMATPHVAGVASLMLSVAPSMTPAQVAARLKATARAFPTGTGSDCTTSTCGAGIVDAAAAVAGLTTVTPTWTKVADEWKSFTTTGAQTVRFGTGSNWVEKVVSGSGVCTYDFFGSDPASGYFKECDVSSVAPSGSYWTRVATEGQVFTLSATRTVRYGAGSNWVTKSLSGSVTCTNDFFGSDPAYGITKECDVLSQ